mmetsp:Transcript_87636/g.203857  ORF Transcript_87636/g.203857 Transcript_87636/m.203857 type:complete len:343 (+) Transcript_87636:906-1934(+)
MRRMRSKKWQAFSTSVPPVKRLKRFQLSTFFRNGKRCSRMDTTLTSPCSPESVSPIKCAIGGIHRYSMPVMKTLGGAPVLCASASRNTRSLSTSSQSATVVQSGFSQRICLPIGIARLKMSMCVKLGVQTMTASTKSHSSKSSALSNTAHDLWPSSSSASARALVSESDTATITATPSPKSATLRMCSLPMAPVPMMPTRRGAGSACSNGGPRSAANTRRGGSKLCRACITSVLSMKSTSPACHGMATWRSCMKRATSRSAVASTAEPSPSSTDCSPTLRASFHPVKAAMTELKNTRWPVRSSRHKPGNGIVTVRQSPFGNHEKEVPCSRMAASASSRVSAL